MFKVINKKIETDKNLKEINNDILDNDIKVIHNYHDVRRLHFKKYKNIQYDIIFYNQDLTYIELEKITTINKHINFERIPLTKDELLTIFTYNLDTLLWPIKPLLLELINLLIENKTKVLNILDYKQTIYHYSLGNAYIIVSSDYSESSDIQHFLNPFKEFNQKDTNIYLTIAYEGYLSSTITSFLKKELRINIV